MMSGRRFGLTEEAERDFRSILRHTSQEWGEEQRDIYADRLVEAIHRLAQFPSMGKSRDDLGDGVRVQSAEQHLIVYRLEADSVLVLRLLHRSMNAFAHVQT